MAGERSTLLPDRSFLQQPLTLTWENVSYSITSKKETKVILDRIDGYARPGEILAIMGSTGAGKSSLLDVLAQRKNSGKLQGDLLVNGQAPDRLYKRISAYVTQDDCLVGSLTVRETLQFYANLKLPSSVSKESRRQRVEEVLDQLGLKGVADSRVGTQFKRGISGGEKKRLSVGCQLITDPHLLFLDEPTTGLDAYNSLNVLENLSAIARDYQRTIICTIHQPRSTIFELFDSLLLLSKGRVVYFGPARDAIAYFAGLGYQCGQFINPADFFIDVTLENDKALAAARDGVSAVAVGGVRRAGSAYQRSLSHSTDGGADAAWNEAGAAAGAAGAAAGAAGAAAGGAAGGGRREEPHDLKECYEASEMHVEAKAEIRRINEHFEGGKPSNERIPEYASGWFRQVYYVSGRVAKTLGRNPFTTYIQTCQTLFLALLVGTIYWQLGNDQQSIQDRIGCLFFIITNQAFGMLSSLNLFLEERNLFNRDRAAGVFGTSAYFFSKSAVEAPFLLLFPFLFGCIAYWMIGLQAELAKFGIFLLTLVIFTAVASSLFLFIGAISPNNAVAQIISPLTVVLFLLFGGFYVNNETINHWWFAAIVYLSPFHYGYAALIANEFDGLVLTCPNSTASSKSLGGITPSSILPTAVANNFQAGDNCSVPCFTAEDELELLGMDDVVIWQQLVALLAMVVGYRILAYLALRFLYKEKR